MNGIVLTTMLASATAAVFFALRAHMLKPEKQQFPTAHLSQRLCVGIMAAVAFVHASAVFTQGYATMTEALLTVSVGIYAIIRWWSLRSQRRPLHIGGSHAHFGQTTQGIRTRL